MQLELFVLASVMFLISGFAAWGGHKFFQVKGAASDGMSAFLVIFCFGMALVSFLFGAVMVYMAQR